MSRQLRITQGSFASAEEVPVYAISMGVGTILEARELFRFLSNGEKKADIVAKALEGPLSSSVVASVIQLHPKVTVILDEEAAGKLSRANFYKFAASMEGQVGLKLFRAMTYLCGENIAVVMMFLPLTKKFKVSPQSLLCLLDRIRGAIIPYN